MLYVQGMLKGEELSAAYASADIFMMPSETETLGFVALEAMASGLAVVAVAAGGLVDIITRPGQTGVPRWRVVWQLRPRCQDARGCPCRGGVSGQAGRWLARAGQGAALCEPAAVCSQASAAEPAESYGRPAAGFLYERGDYQAAFEVTRTLVLDAQARAAVATAARQQTETLGWLAAIRRVRNTQYGRAITTFRAHKRCAPSRRRAAWRPLQDSTLTCVSHKQSMCC